MLIQLLQDHVFWKILSWIILMALAVFSFLGHIKMYQIFLYLMLFTTNIAACMQYGILGFFAHIVIIASLPIVIFVIYYVVSYFIYLRLHKNYDCELSPFCSVISTSSIIRTYKLILSGEGIC